jgi:hypothetical protein
MRKITSLTLGFSFLIMSYTGIMLFLAPHGKIAHWGNWHLWGLSKTQYGDVHTTSMLVFMVLGILHVYYNWKIIVSYLKNKAKEVTFTKKEFLISILINVIFVLGTLFYIQPFKAFLDMESSIKDSWIKKYGEPPYGHAEETKLKAFCRKQNIDLEYAKEILTKNKIVFTENQSLKKIAQNNNISPEKIYMLIKKKSSAKSTEEITKMGRKTLKDLSDMGKIDLDSAIKKLKEKGLDDTNENSKMKNIADDLDMKPREVFKIISNK